jgi:hypothetical protein
VNEHSHADPVPPHPRPAAGEVPAEPRPQVPPPGERLPRPAHVIRIGGRMIVMPASRVVRIALGVGLVLGGVLGFLPILGFWMIPLGLLILSIDLAIVRRWRRRSVVWFERRFPGVSARIGRWTAPRHLRGGRDRS